MSWLSNIVDSIKTKTAVMQERKRFLTMVEDEAKPIRRAAYLQQKKLDAIKEGQEMARKDTEKLLQKRSQPQDFGIGSGLNDPFKFLNSAKVKPTKLEKDK